MHSANTQNAPAPGRSNRHAIASAIAAVLVIVGFGWVALKAFDGSRREAVPSIEDGTRFVFVASRADQEVTVIDSKSDRVVTRIATAGIPAQALVSDAAGVVAATIAGRSSLEVIELADPKRRTVVDLTITPDSMVLSPDGYLIAAADSTQGSVSVVSLQKRKLLFRLPGFGDPRNLTFGLDSSQLYVTDRKTRELVVIDVVQQAVFDRLALTRDAPAEKNRKRGEDDELGVSSLTRTPDGRYGFISLSNLDSLLVVDLGTLKPLKQLRMGRAPSRPYGTADGRLMLVPNEGDQSVSIIDTTTVEVIATLPGARGVTAINTGWFESLAFVMSRDEKRVVVLDLMKFKKLGDIELPGSPGPGVVTSTGQKLYVSLSDADRVAIIDTQTHKLATVIDGVGRSPWGAAMARSNNYCH